MTQANTQIPGFGLLGHPLGHSMSPFIHQALFALSGRPQPYALHDVAPEDLKTQVPKLLAGQGFNITIPYKVEIIPFLTQLSEKAELYQSVNTVEIKDGRYIGHNTDVDGFLHGIRSLGVELSQGPVLMLGSGEAILESPFRFLAVRQVKRFARSVAEGRAEVLHTTMPLPKRLFVMASTRYWIQYGRQFGVTREQMQTPEIEG